MGMGMGKHGKYGMGMLDMDDEYMGDSALKAAIHGSHHEILMQWSPEQLGALIEYLNKEDITDASSGKHSFEDGIDTINDILESIPKLNHQQYSNYLAMVVEFSGRE